MNRRVYLDNHSTTQLDPRVLSAMMPYFGEKFGNAASKTHFFGWETQEAVEEARKVIAKIINASAEEIIFTSGATESTNIAIKGAARFYRSQDKDHIITVQTEHRAVLDPCKALEAEGFKVTCLPATTDGLVDPSQIESAITDKTILISVMHANNEIGVIQSIEQIGKIVKKRGVLFHSDAAQSLGKIAIDVNTMGIDLLSISAHKIYGPKGIGALYIRKFKPRVRLTPIIDGGGHEQGLRSGTLNVPAIIGFAKACEICEKEMDQEQKRILELRERLREGIINNLDHIFVNGNLEKRLAGNLNLSFAYVEGESLLNELNDKGIAVSTGSACSTATLEPSHVLKAIGVSDELIHSSLRFGIGRFNTKEEIEYTIGVLVESVKKLRKLFSLDPGLKKYKF